MTQRPREQGGKSRAKAWPLHLSPRVPLSPVPPCVSGTLQDESGRTPLAAAVWYGNHHPVQALIKAGASLVTQDPYGQSPLHYSLDRTGTCPQCAIDIRLLLPGLNGDVDVQDSDGETPLHFACRSHDAAVVGLLLEARASLRKVNVRNERPLQVAAANTTWGSAVVEPLLQEGADIDHCTYMGGVLHYGAQNEAVVRLLVASGCNSNLTDEEGWSALHYCCDMKQVLCGGWA